MQGKVLFQLLTIISVVTTGLYYLDSNYTLTQTEQNVDQKIFDSHFFEEPMEELQNEQKLLEAEQEEEGIFSIISYEVDFMAKIDQNNDNNEAINSQGAHVKGIADVYTKFNQQAKMYDIAVAFRDISLYEEFISDQQGQSTSGPSDSKEQDDMTIFIISVSSETGETSNFREPQTGTSSKYLKWAAEQLIANIFPETRPDAYKPDFAIVEQDNFGNYMARYTYENLSPSQIKLNKEYTSGDYLEKAQSFVENPEVVFQNEVIMDRTIGAAVSGNSRHLFTVGNQEENDQDTTMTTFNDFTGSILQTFTQQDSSDEALWAIQDFINQNEFKETTFQNYKKIDVQFKQSQNLQQEQSDLQEDGEQKIKLTRHHHHHHHHHHIGHSVRPRRMVHKVTKTTKKVTHAVTKPVQKLTPKPVRKIVRETIKPVRKVVNEVVIKPTSKIIEVTVEEPIRQAGKLTKKITKKVFHIIPKVTQLSPLPKIVFPPCHPLDLTGSSFHEFKKLSQVKMFRNKIDIDMEYVDYIDHSVIASYIHLNKKPIYKIFEKKIDHCSSFQSTYPQKQTYPLFQVTYPVFGIVWLTFEVRTDVDLTLVMKAQSTASSCNYSILPTFAAGVDSIGSASLVNVIKTGAFADGFFLDSNLQLHGSLNRHDFSGKIDFKGQMRAVAMKIGFNYSKINCHMKKMVKNMLRMKRICSVQKNQQKVLYTHHSHAHNRNFWSKQLSARK